MTDRLGPAIALATPALLTVLVVFAVIVPMIGFVSRDDTAYDLAQRQLATYRGIAATGPRIEQALAAARTGEISLAGVLPGDNAASSAAYIQGEIKRLVEQNGGEIRSTQVLQPKAENGFERIAIQYDLSLSPNDLQATLYQIETHNPYFLLDTISIQAPETQRAGTTTNLRLSIRWQVSGYRKGQAP